METFVPATIKELEILEPGELCRVCLSLPTHVDVNGKSFSLQDHMRPGTAFLLKPRGARTQKYRRRMYTRSNVAKVEPGLLETFINHTHGELSDTSVWWQSEEAHSWYQQGIPLDVRIQLNSEQGLATVYENTSVCKPSNLRLEDDGKWESMPMVCVGFGTGVTPFLSYVRYWVLHRSQKGGRGKVSPLTLIVSARNFSQLMCHDELLEVQRKFRGEFFYYPALTRHWSAQWEGARGRIITVHQDSSGNERIVLSNLFAFSPDLAQSHLRLCGNKQACSQIVTGLDQASVVPLSIRSESW